MEKEITLLESSAKGAHKIADKATKKVLEELFKGKVNFSGKITDRVKSFADACDVLGIHQPSFSMIVEDRSNGFTHSDVIAFNALMQLTLIVRALNEGWTPDWKDSNQVKYYVWLTDFKSGSGFSGSGYDCSYAATHVGSRLCFKSAELAEYAGVQFRELYNQYFNL